jgi:N-acetylneuraminic acid mutarotase
MPVPHSNFALGAAPNAAGQWLAYTFGGSDPADDETGFYTYTYNVATDTWGFGGGFSLIDAANLNGVGKIGNKFYFTGGESCCDEDFQTFNDTWAYQPSTQQLFHKAVMPKATQYGVTGVIDGKLYVLPGYCSGEAVDPGHCAVGGPIRQLYRYDPSANTWITRRQAPHFHTFGAAGVINDKFYVVGNWNQGPALDAYDPATDTWQTLAPIPTPGERLFGAVLQSKLFVISWSHPSGAPVTLKAFLYDPATNTWTPRAAPPLAAPIVRVTLNGQARLLLVGSASTYLYTP